MRELHFTMGQGKSRPYSKGIILKHCRKISKGMFKDSGSSRDPSEHITWATMYSPYRKCQESFKLLIIREMNVSNIPKVLPQSHQTVKDNKRLK